MNHTRYTGPEDGHGIAEAADYHASRRRRGGRLRQARITSTWSEDFGGMTTPDILLEAELPTRNSRVSLRESVRGRPGLTGLLALLVLAGTGFGGHALWQMLFLDNADYALRQIELKTDGWLTETDIMDVAGLLPGESIFAISLTGARRELLSLSQITDVEMRRVMPDRLELLLRERQPVAWISGGNSGQSRGPTLPKLIDRDGMVFEVLRVHASAVHLPLIIAPADESLETGRPVSAEIIFQALELVELAEAKAARTGFVLRVADTTPGHSLIATGASGAEIILSRHNLGDQLDRLGMLLTYAEEREGRRLGSADLRLSKNTPVTFQASHRVAADQPAVFEPAEGRPEIRRALPVDEPEGGENDG